MASAVNFDVSNFRSLASQFSEETVVRSMEQMSDETFENTVRGIYQAQLSKGEQARFTRVFAKAVESNPTRVTRLIVITSEELDAKLQRVAIDLMASAVTDSLEDGTGIKGIVEKAFRPGALPQGKKKFIISLIKREHPRESGESKPDYVDRINGIYKKTRKLFRICALPTCFVTPTTDKLLKTCAACRRAFYCSQEHQKADWKRHKPICKEHRAEDSKTPEK